MILQCRFEGKDAMMLGELLSTLMRFELTGRLQWVKWYTLNHNEYESIEIYY